ncbi:hypothetical protein KFK09_016202 [Dendrobium nobile]|uniref:magnesium chelatase n=1 Tax=Dendrobium nobile TaxID=94219 RepID=A0A8T3AY39_DENNO|nr:hypothetical protein KFK09_016202 [Dendrobium nobile]
MASLVFTPFILPSSKSEQFSSLSHIKVSLFHRLTQPSSKVFCAAAGNGLFTQTKPEVRRIIPDPNSAGELPLPRIKIVYVVLEAQYQSSLSAAVRTLNAGRLHASFELVGYLVEELRDENTYSTFCDDLATANIFIGSLIFVEVMRLNKLGSFSMSQLGQSKSPFFQLFNRKKQGAGFAESMLKLVRTLPKVLKYLPSDKAQDAGLYILSLQFWLGGSQENLENFLKMISGSYIPTLKTTKIEYSDPVLFLDS